MQLAQFCHGVERPPVRVVPGDCRYGSTHFRSVFERAIRPVVVRCGCYGSDVAAVDIGCGGAELQDNLLMTPRSRLIAAAVAYLAATAYGSAIAARFRIPAEPLGVHVPVSVGRSLAVGLGAGTAIPWLMAVGAAAAAHASGSDARHARVCSVIGCASFVGTLVEPVTWHRRAWSVSIATTVAANLAARGPGRERRSAAARIRCVARPRRGGDVGSAQPGWRNGLMAGAAGCLCRVRHSNTVDARIPCVHEMTTSVPPVLPLRFMSGQPGRQALTCLWSLEE